MSNSNKCDRLRSKIDLEMKERKYKQLAKKSQLKISKDRKQANIYIKRRKIRSLHQYLHQGFKISPHPLILIGAKQFEHIKENSIVLRDMTRYNICKTNNSDGGLTSYAVKNMGNNVKHLFVEGQNIIKVSPRYITGGYLAVLCEAKAQCLQEDPSICFISADRGNDDVYEHALLMLYVTNIDIGVIDVVGSKWVPIHVWENDKDYTSLKRLKKSTIKSNDPTHHYGSSGECFSFGLRNDFKKSKCQRISLTQYASNNDLDATHFIQYIGDYFDKCHQSFNKIISGIPNFLNITCRFMQYESKHTDVKEYVTTVFKNDNKNQSKNFMLTGNININAKTRYLHCEKDTTYTTICVPKQTLIHAYVVFEFRINESTILQLDVEQNSAFTYSAYCLTHRQLYTIGQKCMNISSYSARSVFNHFRKSLERVKM